MNQCQKIVVLSATLLACCQGWATAQTTNAGASAGDAGAPMAARCVTLSPEELRFAAATAGSTNLSKTIHIANQGTGQVSLKLHVTGSDFALLTPDTVVVPKGAVSAAVVTFKPAGDGSSAGALIVDGCPGGALVVPLAGDTLCAQAWHPSRAFWLDLALAAGLALLYWLVMVVTRWNRVARPSRFVLEEQIASVEAELKTLPGGLAHDAADELLKKADELMQGGTISRRPALLDFLFWSRGQEMTGWGYTYDAQIRMADLLPQEAVQARLEAAAGKLARSDDGACRDLADLAKRTLAQDPPIGRLRAILAQVLSVLYDKEYNTYTALVSWQNKASWLVASGLLLIVVLTGAFPNQSILFLLGAAGGLVSRLSRSLDRKEAPTDYGASWTTLFLSPVSGALGGWVGILVAELLVKLQILNSAFGVRWCDAHAPMALAVALAFGFSERLLDSVFDKLDEAAIKQAAPAPRSGALAIVDPGILQGTANEDGSRQLQATGTSNGISWSLVKPEPAGISLTSQGLLKWSGLSAGTVTFQVQVEDQTTHDTRTRQLSLRIV